MKAKTQRQLTLPPDFDPPTEIVEDDYVLEVLAPKHNEMDYDAWNSSKEELKGIFGPRNDWPGCVTSLEQNLADLEKHYREFTKREAFAYTILNRERTACIGCLYIRPTPVRDYDCRVDFWFTNAAKSMEAPFYKELDLWLRNEWGFTSIAYPGRSIPWERYLSLVD